MGKKAVIAVDLDDVLVATAPATIAFCNRKWNTTVQPENFYQADYAIAWQAPDHATAIKRVYEFIGSEEHSSIGPDPAAVSALKKLQENYLLYIVTGRPDFTETATRRWLTRHFPEVFAGVVFSNYFEDKKVRSKGDICKELGASLLIDDHPEHVLQVAEKGINAVLFGDYEWNRADRLPSLPKNITRCKDWPAVVEYFSARG